MSVYYVHAPDNGLCKIGYAKNPRARLHQIQVHSPTRVILLAIEDGGREIETKRHFQFVELRKRGEWFWYRDELKSHVESLPPYVATRKPLAGPLGAWLRRNALTQEQFAGIIGSSGATICRICSGGRMPTYFVEKIYIATNGEVDANALFGLSPELLTKPQADEAAA
jgi:hypothetical protein